MRSFKCPRNGTQMFCLNKLPREKETTLIKLSRRKLQIEMRLFHIMRVERFNERDVHQYGISTSHNTG